MNRKLVVVGDGGTLGPPFLSLNGVLMTRLWEDMPVDSLCGESLPRGTSSDSASPCNSLSDRNTYQQYSRTWLRAYLHLRILPKSSSSRYGIRPARRTLIG